MLYYLANKGVFMKFYNSEKFKYYLRTEAARLNITPMNAYNTFFSRVLLERIVKVAENKLVVAGSLSQLIHLGRMIRPVTDIDMFSRLSNEKEVIDILRAVFADSIEDLYFLLKDNYSVSSTGMLSLKCDAHFGSITHNIDLDINIGNSIIYEEDFKRVPRVFSTDTEYFAFVPSFEEHFAQKLCIVAETGAFSGKTNSRIKDLYDIYQLHGGTYDLQKFSLYFEKMLVARGKVAASDLTTEFLDEEYISQNQDYWDRLSKKYDFLDKEITLAGTVFYTRAVLSEQLKRIRDGENVQKGTMLSLIAK